MMSLSQPQSHGRRQKRCVLMAMHVLFIGSVFLLDPTLQRRIRDAKWDVILYGVLVLLTLFQYLYTANSSPGYLADLLRASSGMHATFVNTATLSIQANTKNGSLNSAMSLNEIEQQNPQSTQSSSFPPVMDLYPRGPSNRDWTCRDCLLIKPPRTKHCRDCDKCVLQYDHHCDWLGTCISKRNHCRFWWYIFEQTILAVWTVALYIQCLHLDINESWWKGFIGLVLFVALILILLLLLLFLIFHTYLVLTNQTTYEISRRKRIDYLSGVPREVHPFSKGVCRNIYDLCLSRQKGYILEAVPPQEELEARARPYTCRDVIYCRCC